MGICRDGSHRSRAFVRALVCRLGNNYLDLVSVGLPNAKLGIDQRQVSRLDAQTSGHAVGLVGKIEPLFRKTEQVALVCGTARATCQFDNLCGVSSVVVLYGHGVVGSISPIVLKGHELDLLDLLT